MIDLALILGVCLGGTIITWAIIGIFVIGMRWMRRTRVLTDEEQAALVQRYLDEGDAYVRAIAAMDAKTTK